MSAQLEKMRESLANTVSAVEETGPRRLVAKAEPENISRIFRKLLEDFKGDLYLDFIAAVDYPEDKQFEINYSIWIYSLKTILTIKVRLSREKPKIETISDLIPSAVNHEQEVYDLMGIDFSGNPHLRRGFLVAEELKDSFPLRKDEAKQA